MKVTVRYAVVCGGFRQSFIVKTLRHGHGKTIDAQPNAKAAGYSTISRLLFVFSSALGIPLQNGNANRAKAQVTSNNRGDAIRDDRHGMSSVLQELRRVEKLIAREPSGRQVATIRECAEMRDKPHPSFAYDDGNCEWDQDT